MGLSGKVTMVMMTFLAFLRRKARRFSTRKFFIVLRLTVVKTMAECRLVQQLGLIQSIVLFYKDLQLFFELLLGKQEILSYFGQGCKKTTLLLPHAFFK